MTDEVPISQVQPMVGDAAAATPTYVDGKLVFVDTTQGAQDPQAPPVAAPPQQPT